MHDNREMITCIVPYHFVTIQLNELLILLDQRLFLKRARGIMLSIKLIRLKDLKQCYHNIYKY